MNADLESNYRAIGDIPFGFWQAELTKVDSPLLPWSQAMYETLSGFTALGLAQIWRECQYETDRNLLKWTDFHPFNMKEWEDDPRSWTQLGVSGTKPTGVGGPGYLCFTNPVLAAREYRRRISDDPTYKRGIYTRQVTLKQFINNAYVRVDEQHPVTGVDNRTYYTDIVKILTRFAREEKAFTMATTFTKHDFPGLPNPVYLPDWLRVQIKIIPSSVAGWTSGQRIPAANFTSTTFHDTDNMTSSAPGEWSWAAEGGRATLENGDGSYNGIFDQNGLIVCQRFDELVGHAANHTGNVTSYAFEQAGIGPSFDFDKSLDVGMWVHAGVLQAMEKMADTSMFQHHHWSGKDCPKQIRRKRLWSSVEKTVDQRIAQIKAFILGQNLGEHLGTLVTFPSPEPIPELDAISSANTIAPSYVVLDNAERTSAFFVGDRYEAIRDTPRRRFAFPDSEVIGPPIRQGESLNVDFVFQNSEGHWGYTPFGTRVALDDLKRVSDTKTGDGA